MVAVGLGLVCSLAGLTTSFSLDVPPGPTIVLIALAVFLVSAIAAYPVRRRRQRHPHPAEEHHHG
jgi:zinc transport system permease protein